MILATARVAPEKTDFRPVLLSLLFAGVSPEKHVATTFWQKYKDPRWQKRRLEIMSFAEFKCQTCEADDKTLNVHHTIYRKGVDPWDYPDEELLCLCEDCHEEHHAIKQRLQGYLAKLHVGEQEIILGYAAAQWIHGWPVREIQVTSYEMAIGVAAAFGVTEHQVIDIQTQHGKVTHDLLWAINHPEAQQ